MAIARSVRPSVLVAGEVVRVRELRRKADQTQYGTEVVVGQDSGAQIGVTVYLNKDAPAIPPLGSFWVAEAEVEESREFGASLTWASPGFDLLDRIHSALTTAGK